VVKVTVEVQGINDLVARFDQVRRGTEDFRQLGTWDWVQSEFYKVLKAQFGSEGAAGRSGKWKELSPKYKVWKQRKYGSLPILQLTGRLYRSLTSQGGDAVVEKSAQEMTLGTRVPYAGYHQSGTGRMSARKVIDFSPEQEKQLKRPIQEKLKQLIANARLRDERGF
jgi:phage gpG-like protein